MAEFKLAMIELEVEEFEFNPHMIVESPCPKCGIENSIIIANRKDRLPRGNMQYSTMKFICMSCDLKETKEMKWVANIPS